jgi:hypothetical protein
MINSMKTLLKMKSNTPLINNEMEVKQDLLATYDVKKLELNINDKIFTL